MKRSGPLKKHKRNGWNSTLKPGKPPQRKKPMNRRWWAKPAYSKASGVRRKYRIDHPTCSICQSEGTTEVHEIRGGLWRFITVSLPSFWLAVCRGCHRKIHDTNEYPWARQLAIKLASDPENYNLAVYNATLVGEVPITQEEVDQWA